jgi:hypothetical protein
MAPPFYGAFGYVDTTGSLILVTSAAQPQQLHTAFCTDRRRFDIAYERHQERSATDNSRQVAANFSNERGDVFRVRGRAYDDETCFLASDELLSVAHPLPLEDRGTPSCDADQQGRIARVRTRRVEQCWQVGASGAVSVLLVQFENRGDSALASLALAADNRVAFLDFPATNSASGTWRVDDEGKLSPDAFEILCLMEGTSLHVIGLAWAGAEGGSLKLAVAGATGDLKVIVDDYRYWVPL